MTGDFQVTGTEDFKILGAKLKVADKALRLKLGRNIRAATEPLKDAVKESAEETLPKSGGLADIVAGSKFSTRVTYSSSGLRVRFTTSNSRNIRGMDGGRLRHPVYGNRQVWVNQDVKPDWWSNPINEATPEITAAVTEAINEIAEELT